MKKAVLIKSDLTVQPIELTEPLHWSLHAAVGGLSKKTLYCNFPFDKKFPTANCATLQDEPDMIMKLFCDDCQYLKEEKNNG